MTSEPGAPVQLTVKEASTAAQWDRYFRDYCSDRMIDAVSEWPERASFNVDFRELDKAMPVLANAVLATPAPVVCRQGQQALQACLEELGARRIDIEGDDSHVKPRLSIVNLPDSELRTPAQLEARLVGRLVKVPGMTSAVGKKRFELLEACWECKVCTSRVFVVQEDQQRAEPAFCETCDAQRPWRLVEELSKRQDVQLVHLQEHTDQANVSGTPSVVAVRLRRDLVREPVQPGAKIVVTGILGLRYIRVNGKATTESEPVVEAFDVQPDESEVVDLASPAGELEKFRNLAAQPDAHARLARCIAPSVYGQTHVKLSCLYAFAGGQRIQRPDGSVSRDRIHVLVAGDPGTAKSELLRLLPRYVVHSVSGSGQDANRVGLGAGILKDESTGQYMLQPGLLVLGHRGCSFLDELGLLEQEHRGVLNNILEQGVHDQLKILKCRLPAETTLIAAMNPVQYRFDAYAPFIEQLGLSPALRSRFALVWCLQDLVDKDRDEELAKHQMAEPPAGIDERLWYGIPLNAAELRRYIHQARQIHVTVPPNVAAHLRGFYHAVRANSRENPAFNPRQNRDLTNLCVASARLRFATEASLEDARRAIELMQQSLRSCRVMDDAGFVDGHLFQDGVTKAQYDRVRLMTQLVKDLQRQHSDGYHKGFARVDELVERAAELGIDEDQARKTLAELQRTAVVYARGGSGTFAMITGA